MISLRAHATPASAASALGSQRSLHVRSTSSADPSAAGKAAADASDWHGASAEAAGSASTSGCFDTGATAFSLSESSAAGTLQEAPDTPAEQHLRPGFWDWLSAPSQANMEHACLDAHGNPSSGQQHDSRHTTLPTASVAASPSISTPSVEHLTGLAGGLPVEAGVGAAEARGETGNLLQVQHDHGSRSVTGGQGSRDGTDKRGRLPQQGLRREMRNQVVLITGGSSGIGLEAARLLHAQGAKVISLYMLSYLAKSSIAVWRLLCRFWRNACRLCVCMLTLDSDTNQAFNGTMAFMPHSCCVHNMEASRRCQQAAL